MQIPMRALRWLIWLPVLCGLSACIQVDVRFDIHPDGSGQVTETYRVRDDANDFLAGKHPLSAALIPQRLTERAEEMAPGVTVNTPVQKWEGGQHVVQVTYAVPDFQGLVWRFGQSPTPDSLTYRFELHRHAGQPLRVDVVNDPFVSGLGTLQAEDASGQDRVLSTVQAMSGVQVHAQVSGRGEALKSTGRWQSGPHTTLLQIRPDELVAQQGWQDRFRPPPTGTGAPACHAESPNAILQVDCQARISLWLR